MRADVLIVGAGPAGAATALRLACAGWQVTLADRQRFPRDKVCAEYLNPGTVRALDRLGALDALRRAGARPILGVEVIGPRGSRMRGRFSAPSPAGRGQAGLSVRRTVLDAQLVAMARDAGVRVVEGWMATALLYRQGMVDGALFRDGNGRLHSCRARVTVGADGLRSRVAREIGRRVHGAPARLAFVTHMTGIAGIDDQVEMHVSEQGYLGLNPLPAATANVALVVPAARAAEARGRPAEFLRAALERCPGLAGRLPDAGELPPVRVTGPFAASSQPVVAPGAMLVGDAAGFFDPFTGEGIGSALRDAELAAGVLDRALADPGPVGIKALRPYALTRRAATSGRRRLERLIAGAMGLPRLFDRLVNRLDRRGLAETFLAVTGDLLPPEAVLNPRFLWGLVR